MAESLFHLNGLCLGERVIDLSLTINSGVTAVIGHSGAGKSTLLNLLAGFEQPTAGTLVFQGHGERLPLYWVPQNLGLWPHLTALEHLRFSERAGQGEGESEALLGAFDLLGLALRKPDQLSRGEQARLAIARALHTGAEVLLMDEPLAHVDPARKSRYWQVIRTYLAASQSSLIFATHAGATVLAEAEEAICLHRGRNVYHGKVASLYWEPTNETLAHLLGPANWLEKDDAELWFGSGQLVPCCVRPEQLKLVEDKAGPYMVQESRFHGSYAETRLLNPEAQRERTFVHRPVAPIRVGMKAIVGLNLIMILSLFLLGCGGKKEKATAIQSVATWNLPNEGSRLPAPRSVCMGQNGEVFALDTAGRVLRFSAEGTLLKKWWMPDTSVGRPEGVLLLRDGRLAICDTHYHRVVLFSVDGVFLSTFGTLGRGEGEFIYPVAITQDDQGVIYIAEYGGNDRIQRFTPSGQVLSVISSFGTDPGQLQRPSGLAWRDDILYVADSINNRIQTFQRDGTFIAILGGESQPLELKFPYDIAFGSDGSLCIIEYGAGRLTRVDTAGRLLDRYGSAGGGEGQFRTPWGIAVDKHNRILVADTGNRRIVSLVCRDQ